MLPVLKVGVRWTKDDIDSTLVSFSKTKQVMHVRNADKHR